MRRICETLWSQTQWVRGFVIGLLLGLSLVSTPLMVQAQNVQCSPDGDVNQDGRITPDDALLAFRHFLGLAEPPLDACQQIRANVRAPQTTDITPNDALCIFREFLNPLSCVFTPNAVRLEAVEGDGVGVAVDSSQRLVARVTNMDGAPVEGVSVRFRIVEPTAGTRSLSNSDVPTDADGRAETRLSVDQMAGTNRVEASVGALEPVAFAVTGCFDANSARLIRVGGNAQRGEPGAELSEPLVVQMVDEFGNPGAGQTLEIDAGNGAEVTVDSQGDSRCETSNGSVVQRRAFTSVVSQATGGTRAVTDERGEVRFRVSLNAGIPEDVDIRIQVSAPELPEVEPVQFLVIVGAIDTPDIPFDLAVDGNIVFVADRFSGLPVFDVTDRSQPQQLPPPPLNLPPLNLEGAEVRLALDRARREAYVATNFPARLYILDITDATNANFFNVNEDGIPEVVRGFVDLPENVQSHGISGIAVQNGLAYMLTNQRTGVEGIGTLQVVNISNPNSPQIVTSGVELTSNSLTDIAVSGEVIYVTAGSSGLFILEISDPERPTLVRTLGEAENVGFFSGIALHAGRAYAVESQCDRSCNDLAPVITQSHFIVFDLSIPTDPRPQGMVRVRSANQISVTDRFAYLGQFSFGLQVVDIGNPEAPLPLSTVDTPSVVLNLATAGDLIYVTDQVFGLLVIEGAPADSPDSDNDGVINRFDAFPFDAAEFLDTDGDRIGNNADTDDDGDGFADTDEDGNPFADPLDPRLFPPGAPLAGATSIVVDAASTVPPQDRDGSENAPYRSVAEAVRALQAHGQQQVRTLIVRPGLYSTLTTQEFFPIGLSVLENLTIRSTDPGNPDVVKSTVIDAGFSGDIFTLGLNNDVTIDGLTLTHGAHGIFANRVRALILNRNIITENVFDGVALGIDSISGNVITNNEIFNNGQNGIGVFGRSRARITDNILGKAIGDIRGGNGFSGVLVSEASGAEIINNTMMRNGRGIDLISTAEASSTIEANIITENVFAGIVLQNAKATIIDGNEISRNGFRLFLFEPPPVQDLAEALAIGVGLVVDQNSTAVISGNVIASNLFGGIVVERNSRAEISANSIQDNGDGELSNGFGVVLFEQATATLANNTIRNTRSSIDPITGIGNQITGVGLVNNSEAQIRGGAIFDNAGDGIFIAEASRGNIGPDGDVVTVFNNRGAGISVRVDGSIAGIGSFQDDFVCIDFLCTQVAFTHVFGNLGGNFVPFLDFVFGPYVSIP